MASNGTTGPNLQATNTVWTAINGHWLSSCLRVLLELRIADILAKEQGPLSLDKIADKAGVQNETGRQHLYKVLRVLAQHSVLDESKEREFAANAATQDLVQGEKPSLGHMAAHLINAPKWDAWKLLPEAVKTGGTAFAMAHDGNDVYQYGEKSENAAYGKEFMNAMTYFTQHSLSGKPSLGDVFDWSHTKSVMDVGGGHGELLSHCMSFAGPSARGLLFDRPMVIKGVNVPGTFEAKGVKKDRLTMVTGDVREPFPKEVTDAKVDTIIMKHFLSAFSDSDARTIVKHCSMALPPSGKILLLQTLVPEAGDRSHNTCPDGVAPGLFAIEILAQCPGGGWRTLSEWKKIFESQGWGLHDLQQVGSNMHLMVWTSSS